MTAKYGTPYFSNYINSDMEPSDVRAMCPLHSKETVLVMNDYNRQFSLSTVENLYKGHKKNNEYTILLNGEEKRARLNRFDGLSFVKVRTVNGHEVVLSTNHANLILRKDKTQMVVPASALTTDDYLPFSIRPYAGDNMLSYEDGLIVGAFMGGGSIKDDYAVTYSLNYTTKADLMSKLMSIGKQKFGARISTNNCSENCINVVMTSRMLRGLVETFVSGKGPKKVLKPNTINQSLDFRKGVLDGLMVTDGNSKSNRIYTSSEQAVTGITAMLASMGIPTNIHTDDRKDVDGKYSNNPVYTIRMYNPVNGQPSYENVYIKTDDYMWFRIESIEPINNTGIGYCFEVLDDETPYFMLPSGLVTHNCRLRLDLRELRKKSGGFFGSGESTGSIGVVTLNLPRLAYLSKTEDEFFFRLQRLMDIAARSLDTKRTIITRLLNENLYPYTKAYLGSFHNHFSTIGLVGMNEACLNAKWIGATLVEPKAHEFAERVLDFMRERLSDYQQMYEGTLFNLEATPAESTAYRLARHDVKRYPDIITAAGEGKTPYYTNSSQLPVGYTDDIFDALNLQDSLQTRYTSGTVFHAFLGERLPDWESTATLVRKIAENYKLPYYTISPTYSVCDEHGYISGETHTCPKCGKPTEIYSRITGYYRPVKNWNDGKAQEFKDRNPYDFKKAALTNRNGTTDFATKVASDATREMTTESAPVCESCQTEQNTATNHTDNITISVPTLVTTRTCPNCKIAETMLAGANIQFRKVLAEENPELVQAFNILSVPTLVLPPLPRDSNNSMVYRSLPDIKSFIESYQDTKAVRNFIESCHSIDDLKELIANTI